MSLPALQIRRMHNRYRVGGGDNADGLQQQLDRMVSDRLPAVLDRNIGGLYRRLGLSADSLVAVRRLNIRIELAGFPAAAEPGLIEHIGESWGRALLQGLERVMSTTGCTPGQAVVTDTLAIFPDVMSARRRQILQLARNAAPPWWSGALLGTDADAEALPRLLVELATTDPESAARCIVELADDPGPAWLTTMAAPRIAAVARALIAAAGSVGEAVEGNGDRQGGSALSDSLSTAQRAQLSRCGDGDSATLLFAAYQHLEGRPVPADYARLKARLEPIWAQSQRHPVKQASEGSDRSATPARVAAKDAGAATPEWLEHPPDSEPRVVDIESERVPDPLSSDADEEDPMVTGPSWVPVGCGGLLFLIRFALRAWVQGGDLNQGMLALGTLALNSVFDRLSPAARRAAWRRDRCLLQVFAGLHEPLELDEPCRHPSSAVSWASGVIEAIAMRLDDDLTGAPRGSEYVFGHADESLSALDRLLLRPGRLRVAESEARLILPADGVEMGLRRGGWDIDPGWVPQLGRVIRFEYREQ
ncbi:MAG: hypothetical protein AB2827_15910 [Candidatus Thiodiazotropha sp.]